ncbi:MAG: sugar phosphate isomerase/epimerase [Kiritimatiellae bacterium]|nr:sugar phosphate isomerase/epimerase [Kiritimatiellia bacterium]
MKYGVADYGMSVWDGDMWDLEDRLLGLKQIGYEGLERLRGLTEADVVTRSALFRRLGMSYTTVAGPSQEHSIQWTAAMGCRYVWAAAKAADMAAYCRQTNAQIKAAAKWGVNVAIHNHMGSRVESQAELESFLRHCPRAMIVFDTGHLAAVGGDCVRIIRKYADRIAVMHLKDWLAYPPAKQGKEWYQKGRFCGLGKGNIGLDLVKVLKTLKSVRWNGWCMVEHDTHLQDPFTDLKLSRQFIRRAIGE